MPGQSVSWTFNTSKSGSNRVGITIFLLARNKLWCTSLWRVGLSVRLVGMTKNVGASISADSTDSNTRILAETANDRVKLCRHLVHTAVVCIPNLCHETHRAVTWFCLGCLKNQGRHRAVNKSCECGLSSWTVCLYQVTSDYILFLLCLFLVGVCACVCQLSLIHIWRCRRAAACRSRWSPYH